MKKSSVPLTISFIAICLFGGCASGPEYNTSKQQNSAVLEGFGAPRQPAEDGTCIIEVSEIDGMQSGFGASHPGFNWPLHSPSLFLSPGTHTLVLHISEIDIRYGINSGNSASIVGASSSDKKPTVISNFIANHVYRFVAFLSQKSIEVTLWDETNGRATRSQVANWSFGNNPNYTDDTSQTGSHR